MAALALYVGHELLRVWDMIWERKQKVGRSPQGTWTFSVGKGEPVPVSVAQHLTSEVVAAGLCARVGEHSLARRLPESVQVLGYCSKLAVPGSRHEVHLALAGGALHSV